MVFWTAVIPDNDVQVNALAGTAQMHIRDLPELDYYSPQGNGDLASLGPTWQSGYFDSAVSIDVVWNRPVTRRVDIHDAANGFAGMFAENQATVTWSVNSASGFSFTSNPGDFSTSVPEVPGVNGVTVPLNFFAQVAFERNGIFFPQGQHQVSAGIAGAGMLASLVIGDPHAGPRNLLDGQLLAVIGSDAQTLTHRSPATAANAVWATGHAPQASSRLSQIGFSKCKAKALDYAFSDWEHGPLGDTLLESDGLTWVTDNDVLRGSESN